MTNWRYILYTFTSLQRLTKTKLPERHFNIKKGYKNLWPFSQKFLQFLVRFSVKNFVREILRAFHKRIRSLFNLKILLTRNSSLATVSNGLIFRWKLSQLKMNRGFYSQKTYYRPQFIEIEWNQCVSRVLENWRHNHYMCKNRSI